jgi:hypothetical protein
MMNGARIGGRTWRMEWLSRGAAAHWAKEMRPRREAKWLKISQKGAETAEQRSIGK